MASTTTDIRTATRRSTARRFQDWLRTSLDTYIEKKSKSTEIARLNAMSDADLARRGIERRQIVAHVFRANGVF